MSDTDKLATKILVVDDHPLTRNLVKSILRAQGFSNVLVAEEGTQALRMVDEEEIECIICDWNMPGLTGLEVLRALRKAARTQKIPFLMLTAEAYEENVMAAIQEGVNDYVVKPFTPQSLLEKVNRVLKF